MSLILYKRRERSIISEVFLAIQLEILQHFSLHFNIEVPAFEVSNRDPVKTHFPAMQIAIYTHGCV